MPEQRRQVLQMLAAGKITADEAERLIMALERAQPPGFAPRPSRRPRYLRVLVSPADDAGGDGPDRVDIRVPLQLLRAGARLMSLLPARALTPVNAALHRSGVAIDLTELDPQDVKELVEQLDELVVDVEAPDAKVQVFCE